MKKFLTLLLLLLTANVYSQYAVDSRNDSVHVFHYELRMDFRNFNVHSLNASARVYFRSLVNDLSYLRLDLKGPHVDSVKTASGNSLAFHSDTVSVTVQLETALDQTDTSDILVYYSGTPISDAEFGGFYWNSTYAFNVGISLNDQPHNYGKTWFPCIDDFVNRSTYEYFITTLAQHEAVCGGEYMGKTVNGDGSETHHYSTHQPIPAYLASAGVSDYQFLLNNYAGISGNVPVRIAARGADTTHVKNSFINLHSAFDIFENAYGQYRWDRVGYEMCSMSGGAMEHAMNIAYPISLANGSTTYQSVMAHELSHHWWGDLITCRTAEDMWINEGSAAYCEFLFKEQFNGRATYDIAVKSNHKSMIASAHADDGGYWPLSGMPLAHTYGTTTYSKGADVLHTLRSYLGDTLYFSGTKQLLAQNTFSDMDAWEYRDKLSAITGYDLTPFFDAWIFQGGWPQVAIDSFEVAPNGSNYNVTVHLRQKLRGRTTFSNQVPMSITFRDNNWNSYKTIVHSSGQTNTVTVSVPFVPNAAWLNEDQRISHAVTADYLVIKTTGSKNFPYGTLQLNVQAIADSALVVVEQNWVNPDPMWAPYTLSTQRYWNVDGIWPAGFDTKATFRYTGAQPGTIPTFDDEYIGAPEDSVRLMYRPNAGEGWAEVLDCTVAMGSVTDKQGTITVNHLQKGQYAFAQRGVPLGLPENSNDGGMRLYPNPAGSKLKIDFGKTPASGSISITDVMGRSLGTWFTGDFTNGLELNIADLPHGAYTCVISGQKETRAIRFVKN